MLGDKLSSTAPVGLRAYRSSIFGNSADDTGGAAYMQRLGYITLTNSYVGSNVSTRNTGGLASANGSITLNFSTIVDNTAQSGSFATDVVAADIDATGSVVANSAPLSVLASNSLDDTSSVFTQSGSGGTGSVWGASLADIALQPRDGSGPGLAGRTPSTSSVLATNAPNSALNTGVTVDQLGTTRGPSWTIGARQASANPNPPTPPAPLYPPSAPRDVTAFPADSSAVVTWREPESSGSFPVSTYRVTSTPGGKSCLAVTPSLTCAVTGLTNGVIYTFTAEALNGAGWGPAGGPSAPIRPGGVTPAPPPEPLPGPLSPGGSVLQVNGAVDPNVTVEPKPSDRGLDVTGDGWTMDLDGLGPDGQPLRLGPDGSLRLASERDVLTSGTGFLPNSDVDLYVDPPVLLQGATARSTRAAEGIYVGTVRTNAQGTFTGTATLPADIEPGQHVLQAVGYSPSRQTRALSLGVIVDPWIVLDQGTRKADGRHDRIRTTGSTGGIDAGTRLTPYIRYTGQQSFSRGKATITVQSDGTFTWTREIKKGKGLTGYVAWTDIESNRVFWAKLG
jgi:hypothetical protein